MKIDFIKIPIILVALVITIPIGIEAIVWGNLATTIISFFINTYYPKKFFGYGALEQIADYRYIIVSLVLMAVAVMIILRLIDNPWGQLIGGGVVGIAVYTTACYIFKLVSFDMIKDLLNRE